MKIENFKYSTYGILWNINCKKSEKAIEEGKKIASEYLKENNNKYNELKKQNKEKI